MADSRPQIGRDTGLELDDPDHPRSRELIERGNAAVARRLHDETWREDVERLRGILEDEDRLIIGRRRGAHIYDFHRSADHPRGLWRRLPAAVEPTASADWQPVFDLDAHCEETGHEWAWRGPIDRPDMARVMLVLSDNGSDVCMAREFDLEACAFVEGGFETPPARLNLSWDGSDALLVSAALGPDHATRSGWPRTTRRWQRGTTFEDAPVVHEADHESLLSFAERVVGPDGLVAFVEMHTIQSLTVTVERGGAQGGERTGEQRGERRALDLPRDASIQVNHRLAAFQPHEDAKGHPAGTLVLTDFDRSFERVLYEPQPRGALDWFVMTRDWLVMKGHDELRPWLRILDLSDAQNPIRDVPVQSDGTLDAFFHSAQPDGTGTGDGEGRSDPRIDIMVQTMLEPPTLLRFDPRKDAAPAIVAREKPRFDTTGMRTELLEARSEDGTMVPYHIALPREAAHGPVPVVVTAYGGWAASMSPWYQRMWGPALLERGIGVAIAHIRGGGEFGPTWHRAAVRESRPRAFEDTVAIARDLVERGLAPAGGVGFVGASNGGLLASVMLTRYPDDWGAIVPIVPVADMLRFHEYEAGAAWIEEYGDPDVEGDAAFLRAYSPVHNVASVTDTVYPPALIDAPTHDDRVDPAHARRFYDELANAGQDVLLRTAETGGHGGGETSDRQAEDTATRAAFFRQALAQMGSAHK